MSLPKPPVSSGHLGRNGARPRAQSGSLRSCGLQRLDGNAEQSGALPHREPTQVGLLGETEMVGRVTFYGIYELERIAVAAVSARHAIAIGGVMVFGMDQLDSARSTRQDADETLGLKGMDNPVDVALGLHAERGAEFIQRWRDAMIFELGLDEFERFCFAARERRRKR